MYTLSTLMYDYTLKITVSYKLATFIAMTKTEASMHLIERMNIYDCLLVCMHTYTHTML